MDERSIAAVFGAVYIGFEFWIGQTKKTPATSLVQALLFGAKHLAKRYKKG